MDLEKDLTPAAEQPAAPAESPKASPAPAVEPAAAAPTAPKEEKSETTIEAKPAPAATTAKPAAPRPAVARPAPAPAKPADNKFEPEVVAPADLHQRLAALKAEGYGLLENLTATDWGEEGMGVIYSLANPETFKMAHVKVVAEDKETPCLDSVFGPLGHCQHLRARSL